MNSLIKDSLKRESQLRKHSAAKEKVTVMHLGPFYMPGTLPKGT